MSKNETDTSDVDEQENEIDDLEEALLESESLEESKESFSEIAELDDRTLELFNNALDSASISVHKWVEKVPVIVIPTTDCYTTEKNKFEQFEADIYTKIDGQMVKKSAKINVFSSMRTQFKKLVGVRKAKQTEKQFYERILHIRKI